jgi:NAD(P)-dependent dehydrogenase (short-subunit alcohol dehydrogenase family)
MPTNHHRVWMITGVSSGLGHELARRVLERGDFVAGTVRQPEQLAAFRALAPGHACAYQLDLTNSAEIPVLVRQVIQDMGGIDVLVNNAGYGFVGAVEEMTDSEVRHLFETNFFGMVNLIKAVLPHMRERRSGHILAVSSSAGVVGVSGVAMYSATKFAMEGLCDGLAGEVAPFGIKVTVLKPGGMRTDFAGRSMVTPRYPIAQYGTGPVGEARRRRAESLGRQLGDPAAVAVAIIGACGLEVAPLRLVLTGDALGIGER